MDRMQYEAAMGADPKPSIPPGLPSHVTEGPSSRGSTPGSSWAARLGLNPDKSSSSL